MTPKCFVFAGVYSVYLIDIMIFRKLNWTMRKSIKLGLCLIYYVPLMNAQPAGTDAIKERRERVDKIRRYLVH